MVLESGGSDPDTSQGAFGLPETGVAAGSPGSSGMAGRAEHLPFSEASLLIGEQVSFGVKPSAAAGHARSPARARDAPVGPAWGWALPEPELRSAGGQEEKALVLFHFNFLPRRLCDMQPSGEPQHGRKRCESAGRKAMCGRRGCQGPRDSRCRGAAPPAARG